MSQRYSTYNITHFRFKFVLGAIVLTAISISLFRNIQVYLYASGKIRQTQEMYEKHKIQNEELKEQKDEVTSEYFKEKQARDKLGLSKEGELVVILPPEEVLRRLSPASNGKEQDTQTEANWRKWAKLFF